MTTAREPGTWVTLSPETWNQLVEFALAEQRTVVDAAAILIERGLTVTPRADQE